MPHSATVLVFVSLGKTIAQITAEFAPVPGLSPVVDLLCGIIQICENVTHNRHAARQLRDRCHSLVLALREHEEKRASPNIIQARNAVHDRLLDIQIKMTAWSQLGSFKSLMKQEEIAKDIQACHGDISDTLSAFQLTSHFEIHNWMAEFKENQRADHAMLLESMSSLRESQAIIQENTALTADLVKQMMTMFQAAMNENKQNSERVHDGLSANLFEFQTHFNELLPDFYLQSGEVKKIGKLPVRGTATMDIYEGLYLGRQKVAIKVIRSMHFDDTVKRRFTREAKIWGEVWKRDRGKHIVPFYGFCELDGPFPCMISPWQDNGDALKYVKLNDQRINYLKFVVHVCRGLEVLHSMTLVHGDLRAINILVDNQGNPLLSDFGLSKIMQDVADAPLTQSFTRADSCRYFAPESFVGDGVISTATDIYALGMTILEIMTHQQPYRNIKHHFEAGNRASRGVHPDQPTESDIVRRGLDDSLWKLLLSCWSLNPSKRPTIQNVISTLQSK
ncbi:kinase-like domain-containing protein [Panaeolus papilionaceus]|nr:kinase-like domain-containing protein [Panaeolus papilionaceus]